VTRFASPFGLLRKTALVNRDKGYNDIAEQNQAKRMLTTISSRAEYRNRFSGVL